MSVSNLKDIKVPLGQLTVGQRLGGGGFGEVFDAALAGINFPFAIKFLRPSAFNSAGDTVRRRFYKEAEILLRLRHPHIIAIYGLGEHEGEPYILMEKFAGKPLTEERVRANASAAKVLPFIESVVGALAYAHSKNVVHRDIKPSNLMTAKGDARILDFGIAAVLDADGSRLTHTGGAVAGDAYSAPELLQDRKLLDARCDIYSVGACWLWLLTRITPQGAEWERQLDVVDGLSADYRRVLLRCLAPADKRYSTAAQLLDQVKALRAGLRPALLDDELGDDEAYLLGVIASELSLSNETVSTHSIEQRNSHMTTVALRLAYKKLQRMKMVETSTESDFNGYEYQVMRLTDASETWLEKNKERVEVLLRDRSPKRTPTFADVPF